MNIRGIAAAGALLLATGGIAHADTGRTVLMIYSNDIDGPIAHTAVTFARDIHPDADFLQLKAPDHGAATMPLPHDVDCVVGVGRNAQSYVDEWRGANPEHHADATTVQGNDRYETATNIKTAIGDCI